MTDDPFEVAVEHVAWAIREGRMPVEVIGSLGHSIAQYDRTPTWNDAIWAVAKVWESLRDASGQGVPKLAA